MFDSILIANRGEIACRVIATARRLGIRSVAVYSEADASSRHVQLADEALLIGPAAAAESYLRADRLIEAAQRSGALAIHPGYGFLAENADFARSCETAGIVFIGPPASAIDAMGDKARAKQLMAGAGVPLVPGYHGEQQEPEQLLQEATKIGYPLLLKASAGGGGKGMRVVEAREEFLTSLAAARREAMSAFGDERVLLERYLRQPRHVEIQIFADSHGNVLHLFERDCSVQRRHQKVIEEAPAPGMSEELRQQMSAAAIAAARAISYVGAGTVEFLLDSDGSFYFMEMNTRLQVEHPVTEMITGQDLVEWQLMVANGQALPCSQQQLKINGHAIEVRLYAEDPQRDFFPASGTLTHWLLPEPTPSVRIDSGVQQGDRIGIHYDPLLAKLVVHAEDRPRALQRLRRALDATEVVGLTCNRDFLRRVCDNQAFSRGEIDTGFIDRHRETLLAPAPPISEETLALAALYLLLQRRQQARQSALDSGEPDSPWHSTTGWRLNSDNHHRLVLRNEDQEHSLILHYRPDGFLVELPGGNIEASGDLLADGSLRATINGHHCRARVIRNGLDLTLLHNGLTHSLQLDDPLYSVLDLQAGTGSLNAPMPGKIIAIHTSSGSRVEAGTPLLTLEAMKMEHTINAPLQGIVSEIHFQTGQMVEEGVELISIVSEGG
ncbi:MAG: acetyl/propionyl/methylcrotonyl-CoA carboxylase subunit alpha [Desulfuromonadales bacterium]|nr:acetyl/propionyl/methylcrotonyl-CoA carboxylase subunit alpha [Desulfuromonadales bacterium]